MSMDEMAAYAASAIAVMSHEQKLGTPAMERTGEGTVTLSYEDGQVFEVRVAMLHRINKEEAR